MAAPSGSRTTTVVTWSAVGSFIVLMASNGEAFINFVAAIPKVVTAFAEVLPLGGSTILMVMTVSGFTWMWMRRGRLHTQTLKNDFVSEFAALVVAMGLMIALSYASPLPEDVTRVEALLKAFMMGFVTGSIAPLIFKGGVLIARWIKAMTIGVDTETPPVPLTPAEPKREADPDA